MKKSRSTCLYVFDFDNTLVNTAAVIKNCGYKYDFSQLRLYEKMHKIMLNRVGRGHDVKVLSARSSKWRLCIENLLSQSIERVPEISLVKRHYYKWFVLHRLALVYDRIVVIDDMFRGEENDTPIRLFYPNFGSNKIKYITHERVFKIRGDFLL